jgi:hypothetical protein
MKANFYLSWNSMIFQMLLFFWIYFQQLHCFMVLQFINVSYNTFFFWRSVSYNTFSPYKYTKFGAKWITLYPKCWGETPNDNIHYCELRDLLNYHLWIYNEHWNHHPLNHWKSAHLLFLHISILIHRFVWYQMWTEEQWSRKIARTKVCC